ncbi:MAG: DedA family protein [Microscillaceae bacterium]|jgi:membrane-associated protein|nr:DedA family protein [Microscillaceae bacterium]
MEIIYFLIDFILHLDKHLAEIIQNYGTMTYVILFLIIFVETGVVIMPFLPGDSLLFAAGAFAAKGDLNLALLLILLFIAAVLGDTVNYWLGKWIGPKVFEREYWFLKKKYLIQTQEFYEKHGGKTIILARFIPIVRTFAPFIAGVGTMKYSRFIAYNLVGGFIWVMLFTILGYYFANLPIVKENFSLVIFGIIGLSVLPPIYEYARKKWFTKAKTS